MVLAWLQCCLYLRLCRDAWGWRGHSHMRDSWGLGLKLGKRILGPVRGTGCIRALTVAADLITFMMMEGDF